MEAIAELESRINQWKADFEQQHSREPLAADYNDEIKTLKKNLLNLYKEQATQIKGGCMHFISRKKRYCARLQAVGSEYCTLHAEGDSATANGNGHEGTAEIQPSGRKQNLKRPPKRMLNPFVIRDAPPTVDWNEVFTDLSRPLFLDIGCAKGAYIEKQRTNYAKHMNLPHWKEEKWNFLGIELFAALSEQANALESNLMTSQSRTEKDLFYIGGNIHTCLESLKLPNLARVSILFPDPWGCQSRSEKKKKKRVMTTEFASRLAKILKSASEVYIASDWHELALDMRNALLETNMFAIPSGDSKTTGSISEYPFVPSLTPKQLNERINASEKDSNEKRLIDIQKSFEKQWQDTPELWLNGIPFDGVMTERDLVCETQWRTVYRLVLIRI